MVSLLLPDGGAWGPYQKAHAGLPLVQHSLLLMLYYYKQGKIPCSSKLYKR